MSRRTRNIIPGFCYHVLMRGVDGRNIFFDDDDRKHFISLLKKAAQIDLITIHGYCLMTNHIHLVLQPHQDNLSTFVHKVSSPYALEFNKKYDRKGYLFQDRFKAILVQSESYLCSLMRYVHLNPVRAGIVSQPQDYFWSSHLAYISAPEESNALWVTTDFILSQLHEDSKIAAKMFHTFVSANNTEATLELGDILNAMKIGVYGCSSFVKEFGNIQNEEPVKKKKFTRWKNVSFCSDIENEERCKKPYSIESISKTQFEVTDVSIEELRSRGKSNKIVDARSAFVSLYLNLQLEHPQELPKFLDRDESSIFRLEQKAKESEKVRQIISDVKKGAGFA